MIEGFSDFPRAAQFLGFALQVAAGEIDADAIAIDAVQRLFDRDIRAAAAQCHDKLHLVMHIR